LNAKHFVHFTAYYFAPFSNCKRGYISYIHCNQCYFGTGQEAALVA